MSKFKYIFFFVCFVEFPLYYLVSGRPVERPCIEHRVLANSYSFIRCCKWTSCNEGEEVVVCDKNNETDTCRPCPPGYIQPDKTDSNLIAECFLSSCDEQRKWTPSGCVCDTDRGYWGLGIVVCEKKVCKDGETLLRNGSCIPEKRNEEEMDRQLDEQISTSFQRTSTDSSNKLDSNPSTSTGNVFNRSTTQNPYTSSVIVNIRVSTMKTTTIDTNESRRKDATAFLVFTVCGITFLLIILLVGCCLYKKNISLITTLKSRHSTGSLIPLLHNTTPSNKWGAKLPQQLLDNWSPSTNMFSKLTGSTIYDCLPAMYLAGRSVGVIHIEGVGYGTGFVVGSQYILCNLHTLKKISEDLRLSENELYKSTFITFRENNERKTFGFLCSMYSNADVDTTILKMRKLEDLAYPPPLDTFGDISTGGTIDFIGHPNCAKKEIDIKCTVRPSQNLNISDMEESLRIIMTNYGLDVGTFVPPYYGISDNVICFDSSFAHGCSGSPGIVFDSPQKFKVVTFFIGCFPRFLWEPNFPEELRNSLDQNLRFEFGANMKTLFLSMRETHPDLCIDIFRTYPTKWTYL